MIRTDTGIECSNDRNEVKSNYSRCEFYSITLAFQNLAVCNAGLSTGLRAEDILNYVGTQASIREVIMVPGKSFCFLQAESLDDAGTIYELLHGKTTLAQHEGCLYLSYCDRGKMKH